VEPIFVPFKATHSQQCGHSSFSPYGNWASPAFLTHSLFEIATQSSPAHLSLSHQNGSHKYLLRGFFVTAFKRPSCACDSIILTRDPQWSPAVRFFPPPHDVALFVFLLPNTISGSTSSFFLPARACPVLLLNETFVCMFPPFLAYFLLKAPPFFECFSYERRLPLTVPPLFFEGDWVFLPPSKKNSFSRVILVVI